MKRIVALKEYNIVMDISFPNASLTYSVGETPFWVADSCADRQIVFACILKPSSLLRQ
jgi:hypothetical protein